MARRVVQRRGRELRDVLGAQRVRRAVRGVIEGLAENPFQVPPFPEGDQASERSFAVAGRSGQQQAGRRGAGRTLSGSNT